MAHTPIKARLIEEIGTKAWLRVFWDEYDVGVKAKNTCPKSFGTNIPGYHDARVFLAKSPIIGDWDLGGDSEDYADFRWPTKCDYCGAFVPPRQSRKEDGSGLDVTYHIFHKRLYNSASGDPEPGDMYWANWYHNKADKCYIWDNCTTPHLIAILPNGREWDIDGRATNCTLSQDRLHRCWIRKGEPPMITVNKDGHTCSAGAGSIASGDYHGFLVNGVFVP